jgi:hypothetical protein
MRNATIPAITGAVVFCAPSTYRRRSRTNLRAPEYPITTAAMAINSPSMPNMDASLWDSLLARAAGSFAEKS